jgi:hypothetical protein
MKEGVLVMDVSWNLNLNEVVFDKREFRAIEDPRWCSDN